VVVTYPIRFRWFWTVFVRAFRVIITIPINSQYDKLSYNTIRGRKRTMPPLIARFVPIKIIIIRVRRERTEFEIYEPSNLVDER